MYNPQEVEQEILKFWEKNKIFSKLRKKNSRGKKWSFIDGPMTANNPMGVHHAWGRTYKDLYQRFKALQGFDQRYQNGFDCQGLWVEVEVEKDLGLNSKKEIEEYGLDKFSKACRKRVEKYSKIQIEQSIRLGQWMDWDNSYYTMDDYNIEHIWHFLKTCHEKGWLYKGTKVMPWCLRCGTSLAQHELADSYKEMEHEAVYFKMPIKNTKNHYLLVWSTTPWTFPANVAAAVNPQLNYIKAEQDGNIYYLSEKVADKVLKNYKKLETVKGKKLIGLEYSGPFDYLPVLKDIKHKVIAWKEVGEEEGTGIVHMAPGCGEEDHELAKKENLPKIAPIDETGDYIEGFDWLTGKNVKHIHKKIIEDLEKNNFLYKTENYRHRYPVCWRCKEELVFRLVSEWFISSEEIRPLMKENAKKVKWYPEHSGKLMQDWLDNMGDWNISRRRYWGLPLPFYECSCGHTGILGSKEELKKLAVDPKQVDSLPELHKPWIDEIKIKCSKCKKEASRIPDIGDCWLDAGIVPYSTLNYLTDKTYWKKWFPADFITEMREQIRLWFYSMLFMSTTLKDTIPYKSVLLNEKVHDEKGEPMHKSAGNAIWFDEAVEKMGADVMRWMYSTQNPSVNLNFGYAPAKEVKRNLDVIWNLGNYVNLYCKSPKTGTDDVAAKWIISRRESTKQKVTKYLDKLQPHQAIQELKQFLVEDLSRTYGQLIRDNLSDSKVQATLFNSYLDGLTLLSPFLPFMTEKLYKDLTKKESIFLESWPEADKKLIDEDLEKNMTVVKEIIQEILAQRDSSQINVRWPLPNVLITNENPKPLKDFVEIIKTQTNLKQVTFKTGKPSINLDTKLTPELENEGYLRELTRKIQSLRKKAKLNKEDKIDLTIVTKEKFLDHYQDELKEKVNASKLTISPSSDKNFKHSSKETIKEKEFEINFN
ncbi:MAG: isoleucine--tRNA ligase [Nanoarchaeota archaeon]|nr:isoleucine--tRNA ligase [Nanoarchaeota archaeon]|tara:strand:- start:58421 stop:61207 length:2787 start_codon:yes stop_codon:yes gene_type:complete